MTKTATIRARIAPQLKDEAERVFAQLGLSTTDAITLFYRQVQLTQGLPFEIKLPNARTRKTIRDARKGRNVKSFRNVDDLIADLNKSPTNAIQRAVHNPARQDSTRHQRP